MVRHVCRALGVNQALVLAGQALAAIELIALGVMPEESRLLGLVFVQAKRQAWFALGKVAKVILGPGGQKLLHGALLPAGVLLGLVDQVADDGLGLFAVAEDAADGLGVDGAVQVADACGDGVHAAEFFRQRGDVLDGVGAGRWVVCCLAQVVPDALRCGVVGAELVGAQPDDAFHVKVDGKGMAALPGTKEFFAVDAWLANHDVVGMDYTNIQKDATGKAHRVDAGGSLMFKAQGEKVDGWASRDRMGADLAKYYDVDDTFSMVDILRTAFFLLSSKCFSALGAADGNPEQAMPAINAAIRRLATILIGAGFTLQQTDPDGDPSQNL